MRRKHCSGVEVGEVECVGDPELVLYRRPRVGHGAGERRQPNLGQRLPGHGPPRGRVHRVRQVRQLGTVLLRLDDSERERLQLLSVKSLDLIELDLLGKFRYDIAVIQCVLSVCRPGKG